MGNQIAPINEQTIHKALSDRIKKFGEAFEEKYWGIQNGTKDYEWNNLFMVNTKNLQKLNRDYVLTDTANHLLRLKLIWQLSPIEDICKQLWKSYLSLVLDDNLCIICTSELHLYWNCNKYRKCELCLNIGHTANKCTEICACGIIHLKKDHQCKLCGEFGHTIQKCPGRCSCGKDHLATKHKCYICNGYGHVRAECPSKCSCFVAQHYYTHALTEHKCEICFKHGHLENDCTEKCVCGKEHYLVEHYCKLSQEVKLTEESRDESKTT